MARIRTTRDTWQLHVNYGYGDGWEHETTEYSFRDAREQLKCYRENAPEYPARLIRKRERIESAERAE